MTEQPAYTYPDEIPGSAVIQFLEAIGLEPVDLGSIKSVRITPEWLELTRVNRPAVLLADGAIAVSEVQIRVRWGR